jgi:hypothetical protein
MLIHPDPLGKFPRRHPRVFLAGVQEVLEKPGFPLKDCGNDDKTLWFSFSAKKIPEPMPSVRGYRILSSA